MVVAALDDATESNRTMGTSSSRIRSRESTRERGKDQVTAFSLDCLTLPDVSPVELVRAASLAGYGSCSLWVQPPAMYEPMLATPSMAGDLAAVLADHGVVVGNLEVFNLNTDGPIAAYEPALVFGAGLGARTATAIDYGDPRPDMAERLAAFAELCRGAGIEPLVEPISMGNIRTPRDGLELIEAAGVEARLVIDCVHLVRTGCTSESLREIPSRASATSRCAMVRHRSPTRRLGSRRRRIVCTREKGTSPSPRSWLRSPLR